MSNDPKVQILLATFNGEKFLEEQIASILSQSYKNWHLIVHDDGSSDATPAIIRKAKNENPSRITIIEDDFITKSAKKNFKHLISHATAPYIMFCDQDDVWMPNKISATLSRMIEVEKKHPKNPVIIHTDLFVVDEHLNFISKSMFEYQKLPKKIDKLDQILVLNNVTGCTMMLNTMATRLGQTLPDEAIMHDWWIAIKTIQTGGVINLLDEPTIKYRQHSKNTLGSKKFNFRLIYKKITDLSQLKNQIIQAKKAEPTTNTINWLTKKIIVNLRRALLPTQKLK